jgi:hypothetical protein
MDKLPPGKEVQRREGQAGRRRQSRRWGAPADEASSTFLFSIVYVL